MEEVKSWWGIAQQLGLGATFILGVAVVVLWRKTVDDQNYIRKRDMESLEVLNKLTTMLDKESAHSGQILEAVKEARDDIIQHMTANCKKTR